MAQKDLTQKNLEAYPDVFADALNALYHSGRQVIKEEDLQPAPTESFYLAGDSGLKNLFQDVGMYLVRNGQIKMRYMLENHTKVERRMVLRKAGYEGAIYRRQLEEKHVDDVRMDVFEMAYLSADVRKRFRSDLRIIVDYLAEGKEYDPGDRVIRHPEALLQMLYALTGDTRYRNLSKEVDGKENVKMCELLDKYEKRGERRGEKRGEKRGERRGEKKGLERVNKLNKVLIQHNRLNDLQRSVEDHTYQKQLFAEFGL